MFRTRELRVFFIMRNNQIQIFHFNESPISFQKGNSVMVNATEMAKSFGKTPKDWLRTKQSEEFITSLSVVRQICLTELVQVNQGGNEQGTWMHEDVAMEFARWLSPTFAIWCNDKIKELLTSGVATINNEDEMIAKAMQVLNQRLEKAKQEKLQMQSTIDQQAVTIDLQNQELTTQAPKVQYYDTVLQSKSTYTATQIAKECGMSARQLNKFLQSKKFIFYQSGMWMLTAKYQNKGLATTKTYSYTNSIGQTCTNTATVYTEKGREFIHSLLP